MSRCMTASGLKKGISQIREAPKEGTRLRAYYDLLMANKGLPLKVALSGGVSGRTLYDLTDYYGLDIRKLPMSRSRGPGRPGAGPATWVLAGEWRGRVYIDYIAERLEATQ